AENAFGQLESDIAGNRIVDGEGDADPVVGAALRGDGLNRRQALRTGGSCCRCDRQYGRSRHREHAKHHPALQENRLLNHQVPSNLVRGSVGIVTYSGKRRAHGPEPAHGPVAVDGLDAVAVRDTVFAVRSRKRYVAPATDPRAAISEVLSLCQAWPLERYTWKPSRSASVPVRQRTRTP